MSVTLIVDRPSCSRSVLQSRPSCSRSVLQSSQPHTFEGMLLYVIKYCQVRVVFYIKFSFV